MLCQDGIRKSMRSCDFKESLGFGDFFFVVIDTNRQKRHGKMSSGLLR